MKRIFFIFIAVTFMEGCGSIETESRIDQLTEKLFKCYDYTTAEEDAYLADLPEGLIKKDFQGEDLERVRNFLTALPKDHLDFYAEAYDQVGFNFGKEGMGGGTLGMTYFDDQYPQRLRISFAKGATNYAFGHELGHAYDVYLRKSLRSSDMNFRNQINEMYDNEGVSKGSSKADGLPTLRSYAMSSVKEYFAEAYQNYYCGQDANKYFQAKLPKTYELFSKVMKAPRWMSVSIGGQNIHLGLEDAGAGRYYLKLALPKESISLRVCSSKDAAACLNENSLPLVEGVAVNANWKFFRTRDPVMLVSGASFPMTIQGFVAGNATGKPDSQRILELYQ